MPPDREPPRPRKRSRGPLRVVFDSAEQVIAAQLEPLVQAPLFGSGLAIAKSVDAAARRSLERRSRRLLHALNLPAATDIRSLHQHLAAVEERISELAAQEEVDDHEPAGS